MFKTENFSFLMAMVAMVLFIVAIIAGHTESIVSFGVLAIIFYLQIVVEKLNEINRRL